MLKLHDLGVKMRQVSKELLEWSEKAEKGKITQKDIERMRYERKEILKLINSYEL